MPNNTAISFEELTKIEKEFGNIQSAISQTALALETQFNNAVNSAGMKVTEALATMVGNFDTSQISINNLGQALSSIWDATGALNFQSAMLGITSTVDLLKGKIDESGQSLLAFAANIDYATLSTWAQANATSALSAAEELMNSLLGESSEKWLMDTAAMAGTTAEMWLNQGAAAALQTTKETLNGLLDNSIGKLLEETALFGDSEAAIRVRPVQRPAG